MNPSLWLRGLKDRLGWPGLVGLACLLLALLLQTTTGRGLALERAELQGQAALLQERLRLTGTGAPSRDESTAAQLTRFYAGFPRVQTAADWLARVQAAAQRSGIVLQAGEYRLEQRAGDRLSRYAIVLPVRGTYGQIRAFVDGVLADVPSVALDDIEMRRDSAGNPVLEARVRLTLYLQAAP